MQTGKENVGFGRGKSGDQRKRLREEIAEHAEEKEEEQRQLHEGAALFEASLRDCVIDSRYAADYQPIVEKVPHDVLAMPKFWREIFQKDQYQNIVPTGLFSALPPDIQSDHEIQKIFFTRPDFEITRLQRQVLERVHPSLVVEKWLSIAAKAYDTDGWLVRNTPWKLFSVPEKRQFIHHALAAGLVLDLDKQKAKFSDLFSDEAWDEIVRGEFRKYPHKLVYEFEKNSARPVALFSKEELRVLLWQPLEQIGWAEESYLSYLHLPLPTVRMLEYGEQDVAAWKAYVENGEMLSSGFIGYERMMPEDRAWTLSLLRKRSEDFEKGYQEFVRDTLPNLVEKMPAAAVEATLRALEPYMRRDGKMNAAEFCDGLLRPILESQGASAFRALEALDEIVDMGEEFPRLTDILFPDKASAKQFRNVMSKTGARFLDFLSFYFDARFGRDDLHRLVRTSQTTAFGKERNIVTFVDAQLPWTVPILQEFEKRIAAGHPAKIVAQELYKEVRKDIAAIVAGEMPQKGELSDYQLGLLSHVFPPALGVSRMEYARLVQRREDRSHDIPFAWDALQDREMLLPFGKWELTAGEKFSYEPWARLGDVVMDVNNKKIVTEEKNNVRENEILMSPSAIVEVGRSMVRILKEHNVMAANTALRDGYALYLARGGAKLPDIVEGREEGVRLLEWSKDALRDVVDAAMRAYREADTVAFDNEVAQATRKEIPAKAKKTIAKSIAGIIRNTKMDEEQKSERMKAILQAAGVESGGDIGTHIRKGVEAAGDDDVMVEKAIMTALEEMLSGAKGATSEAGKLSSIIVQKILGADGESMEKEMAKWKFIEGAEGGEARKLTFQITKKKLHAVAGLNMGVCVAVDDRLWKKQEFSNVVIFGEDGIARGGMHFEIVRDQGKTYLSLPGINPSLTLLREVNGKRLLRMMLEYAKECAKAIGADAVLIPKNPVIFSNREELHGAVREMELPLLSLSQPHQFSHSPFAYTWDDAYEIAIS